MAQRIFASANAKAQPQSCAEPDAPVAVTPERARAVAYLDLWERQLRHAAALGPIGTEAAPRTQARPRRTGGA